MLTGIRIKEERERLGLTQDEFGALGGVKRLAQSNYEGGKREPGASYFALLKSGGVDVEYIQTGKRTKPIGGNSASLLDVPLLAEVISKLIELWASTALTVQLKMARYIPTALPHSRYVFTTWLRCPLTC